jgi:peptidoglycan/xylan/chitin deacetylase (PgdA/CDA1 family)
VVEALAERHGLSLEKFDATYPPLTAEDVARLAALPGIEVGSHSHRHITRPDLDGASAREEIEVSKGLLQQWTGRPIVHYAYPAGRAAEGMLGLLEQAGYQTAATTVPKLYRPYAPPEWPYRIPRYCVHSGPFYLLAGQVAGVHKVVEVLSRLRHRRGRRHGRQPEDAGH